MGLRAFVFSGLLIGVASILLFCDVSTAAAQERVVPDEMLNRRWPNGVIPFRFAGNFIGDKAEIRACFFGSPPTPDSPAIPGCQAKPCVGWDAVNAVRFIDCEVTGDCDQYPHTVLLIGDNDYNGTGNMRGYKDLIKATSPIDSGKDCDFASGEKCVFAIWLKDLNNFMWGNAHELGHMLGFNHEQSRPDRDSFIDVSNCTTGDLFSPANERQNFLSFIGTYDVQSIMHYPASNECYSSLPGMPIVTARNNNLPSPKDLAKLQLLYGLRGDWLRNGDWCILGGRALHTGDFNNDGQVDLLCHSAVNGFNATGRKWIDYANSNGHFNGTNWSSGSGKFCWGNGRRLHAGDFNGDGRTDVVCHNRNLGTISVDYANSGGELNGKDWPETGVHSWPCRGSNARIHIGDFNGDGRDDLLCHDNTSGIRKIDHADRNGRFATFDWDSTSSGRRAWCNEPHQRLIVGDFDGDSSTDALCHNTRSGHRLIDYTFDHGNLKGTNWDSKEDEANRFCRKRDREMDRVLHAADVNGDGADDLICHNTRIGSISADLADLTENPSKGSGLRGIDAYYDLSFCNAQDARLLIGAFRPNDERADLLCHNTVTGHMAILFAKQGGTFEIPPGY